MYTVMPEKHIYLRRIVKILRIMGILYFSLSFSLCFPKILKIMSSAEQRGACAVNILQLNKLSSILIIAASAVVRVVFVVFTFVVKTAVKVVGFVMVNLVEKFGLIESKVKEGIVERILDDSPKNQQEVE